MSRSVSCGTHRRNPRHNCLLASVLTLLSVVALAQEEASSSGADAEEQAEAAQADTTTDSQSDTATETEEQASRPADSYRPSEDISEDLGVSFPVDI